MLDCNILDEQHITVQRIPSITLILLIILNFLLLVGVAWFKTAIDDSTGKVENLPAIARTVDKKVDTTVDAEKKMSQYNKLRANWYFLKYFQFKGLCSRISIFSLTLQSRKWLYIHTNVRSSAHLTVCFQNSPSSFKFILHFSTFKLFSCFFFDSCRISSSRAEKAPNPKYTTLWKSNTHSWIFAKQFKHGRNILDRVTDDEDQNNQQRYSC